MTTINCYDYLTKRWLPLTRTRICKATNNCLENNNHNDNNSDSNLLSNQQPMLKTTAISMQQQKDQKKRHGLSRSNAGFGYSHSTGKSSGYLNSPGGFGDSTKTPKKLKKQKKSRLNDLNAEVEGRARLSQQQQQQQQIDSLDKWGLPPPTIDDVFPPLPRETLIIPASLSTSNTTTELEYIQDALHSNLYAVSSNHLSDLFDKDGVIKETGATTSKQQQKLIKVISHQEEEQQQQLQTSRGQKMKIRLLHHTPPVLAIDQFLTDNECSEIEQIAFGGNHNAPTITHENYTFYKDVVQVQSAIFSPSKGGDHSIFSLTKRTSTSWFCSYKSLPTLIAKIKHVLGISSIFQMEEPQIVRYRPGQEFTWHYDVVPSTQLANGGQRVATVLVYLNTILPVNGSCKHLFHSENENDPGGATIFRDLKQPLPHLQRQQQSSGDDVNQQPELLSSSSSDFSSMLRVRPERGTALIFFPANVHGVPDDRTLHRGEAIATSGHENEKRIVQMWIHQYPNYTASLPTPYNSQYDAIPEVNRINKLLGYPIIQRT